MAARRIRATALADDARYSAFFSSAGGFSAFFLVFFSFLTSAGASSAARDGPADREKDRERQEQSANEFHGTCSSLRLTCAARLHRRRVRHARCFRGGCTRRAHL